ncbi:hypothetical protein CBR64_20905 [Cellulosimicrobium cellulans]|uniref:Uncharacterized protein n=1 Tax=Cellulosimicrobium cellulans TaxID=1710 RepID=A0A1Y0HZU4_CELCE|nr:hypothetical protein [Cellulosimicrobium cellulans]ARU53519.1 hypothetical protein CBR64_20905 [Cellulosimicrobium cellulans]
MNSDAISQDMEKVNYATERANQLGIDRGIIIRAMAGDTDAYGVVTEAVAAKTDALTAELERQRQAYLDGTISVDEWNAAQDENSTALEELTPRVDDTTSSYNNNADALDAAREAAAAKADADAYAAQKPPRTRWRWPRAPARRRSSP